MGTVSFFVENSGTDLPIDNTVTAFQVSAIGGATLDDLSIGGVEADATGFFDPSVSSAAPLNASISTGRQNIDVNTGLFEVNQSAQSPFNFSAGLTLNLFSINFAVNPNANQIGSFVFDIVQDGTTNTTGLQLRTNS